MNIIDRIKGIFKKENVIYSSEICSDCQKAEAFFEKHEIDIKVKKIENSEYRKELKKKHGKVLVPTIILNGEKFIGFEMNEDKIRKKVGL